MPRFSGPAWLEVVFNHDRLMLSDAVMRPAIILHLIAILLHILIRYIPLYVPSLEPTKICPQSKVNKSEVSWFKYPILHRYCLPNTLIQCITLYLGTMSIAHTVPLIDPSIHIHFLRPSHYGMEVVNTRASFGGEHEPFVAIGALLLHLLSFCLCLTVSTLYSQWRDCDRLQCSKTVDIALSFSELNHMLITYIVCLLALFSTLASSCLLWIVHMDAFVYMFPHTLLQVFQCIACIWLLLQHRLAKIPKNKKALPANQQPLLSSSTTNAIHKDWEKDEDFILDHSPNLALEYYRDRQVSRRKVS